MVFVNIKSNFTTFCVDRGVLVRWCLLISNQISQRSVLIMAFFCDGLVGFFAFLFVNIFNVRLFQKISRQKIFGRE